MKALVLEDIKKLALREVERPVPGAEDVLIKTCASTICTSDLNDLDHNPFGMPLPMIIGHEGAGVIVETGSAVKGYSVGDEVTAHPVMPCFRCTSCKKGWVHLCDDMEHLGLTRGGTFAEYFTIRADRIRKKPEKLTFAQATLMEPVCVCLEAIDRAEVRSGSNVLVVGDGPFGVIIATLVKARKPARVILVGRHAYRLSKVPDAIAIHERKSLDIDADILSATGGEGIDSAILAVGTAQAADMCIRALSSRGTLSVFSAVMGKTPVDLFKVHVKELNIHGSCNDIDYLDEAMHLLTDESLNLPAMITHEFPLDRWADAFALAANGKDSALKVSITF